MIKKQTPKLNLSNGTYRLKKSLSWMSDYPSIIAGLEDILRTQTRDTSEYGYQYIHGLLRMETDVNLANVGQKTKVSGQNLQHLISNSHRSGRSLIEAIQDEIKVHLTFEQAILVLDQTLRPEPSFTCQV